MTKYLSKDEETLKIYHGGTQVAYDRGHKEGHFAGWNQGVIVAQVNDNEFLRGLRDHIAEVGAKAEGDTVTVSYAFLENLVSTIDVKRANNQANIERRKAARA
ncbi:hypothetical protein BLSMQ_1958 [Brevibacterium aurantiacum]|uniref:Uncharacterized protein n=2 Tax=Brevibacterium aurantiacum TaxID=273384 RepID=A0A1D7W4T3_BREAU|nr:hypothetical protein BLSMQ_1958 [Brevibacterium aurantiacum]